MVSDGVHNIRDPRGLRTAIRSFPRPFKYLTDCQCKRVPLKAFVTGELLDLDSRAPRNVAQIEAGARQKAKLEGQVLIQVGLIKGLEDLCGEKHIVSISFGPSINTEGL